MQSKITIAKLRSQGRFQSSQLKDADVVIRKAWQIKAIQPMDGEGVFKATLSTPGPDREGEVVIPTGMDITDFTDNPVLMWSHSYATPPIGKCLDLTIDKDGIHGTFQFAKTPFAQELKSLVQDGILSTCSIGFVRQQAIERSSPNFEATCRQYGLDPADRNIQMITSKASLLENSLVAIPCNRQSLITACSQKSFDAVLEKLNVKSVEDEEVVTKSGSQGGYLVVEDDGIRHLPTTVDGHLDHHLMGAAWSALHEGFRGNRYDGPQKDEAIAKLRRLYKEEGLPIPGEKADETPAEVKDEAAEGMTEAGSGEAIVTPSLPDDDDDEKVEKVVNKDEKPVEDKPVAVEATPVVKTEPEVAVVKEVKVVVIRKGGYVATESDQELAKKIAAGKIV